MAPPVVALIPARSGSRRIPGKNIRPLGGHPLMAYTIAAARQSEVFDAVIVSTDAEHYAQIARHYGAEAPWLRPAAFARAASPDIEWVEDALTQLRQEGRVYEAFSILRPTSPFRSPETIRRAWEAFRAAEGVDSLRAVERCAQHPGKMWILDGARMRPLLEQPIPHPWHSSPYDSLPVVYAQNASVEIAWTRVVSEGRTIAGTQVMPFFTDGEEGFDVNNPMDWELAELLVRSGRAQLPIVSVAAVALAAERGAS